MAYLYWITDNTQEDILTYGYVGITSRPIKDRISQHKRSYNRFSKGSDKEGCIKLLRAIHKKGGWSNDIHVVTVCESTLDHCMFLENLFRSEPNTGWNIRIGGNTPLMLGREVTAETKAKLKVVRSKWVMSDATRLRVSENRKGSGNPLFGTPPWEATSATEISKNTWLFADAVYDHWKSNRRGVRVISKCFKELNYWSLDSMIRKFRAGWSPYEDDLWIKFKEYKNEQTCKG